MPFACIFVADFPVEALLRVEPALRAQALVVLEGKAPLQKVFAANENALRAGVTPGMTKAQVETCSALALRMRSPLQEAAAHAALLDCAQSFSPKIEDAGCDTILLDLAGLESLFGPKSKIAHALVQRASALGLEACVAVAANPDAAVLAARGFSGVTVVPEGSEAQQLGNLPVEVLLAELAESDPAHSAQLLETFSRWGVRDLRALAALPEVALSERLGQEGIRLQQLARGTTSRTLVPVEPSMVFEEAIELEYPLVLLEPLAFLLNRMLEQLCARLGARALATQELRLEMELSTDHVGTGDLARSSRAEARQIPGAEAKCFRRTLRLPVPLLDSKIFLKLLQLDLSAHPPGAPILKIHLSAEPARSRTAQSELFLPSSPEPEMLELTLARIAGMVGAEKTGSPETQDTYRREGFFMQHFTPVKSQEREPSPQKSAVTALRIFRPPSRASVTVREGKPARLTCAQHKSMEGEVIWAAGPWRSSGDWWEHSGWSRDEWDIALQQETGIALYRLVRDLLSGGWFVEGTYD